MVKRGIISKEVELRMVLSLRGSMRHKDWYNRFLHTRWWKELRTIVLERDDYACVKCKSRMNLHVDHMVYPGEGCETPEHLQTLCYACHAEKTKSKDLLAGKNYMDKPIDFGKGDQLFSVLRRKR